MQASRILLTARQNRDCDVFFGLVQFIPAPGGHIIAMGESNSFDRSSEG
jgi:hypothetical protein